MTWWDIVLLDLSLGKLDQSKVMCKQGGVYKMGSDRMSWDIL